MLAKVKPKVGKPLSKDVEERVAACYEENEQSQLLPGAKVFKPVKGSDGK